MRKLRPLLKQVEESQRLRAILDEKIVNPHNAEDYLKYPFRPSADTVSERFLRTFPRPNEVAGGRIVLLDDYSPGVKQVEADEVEMVKTSERLVWLGIVRAEFIRRDHWFLHTGYFEESWAQVVDLNREAEGRVSFLFRDLDDVYDTRTYSLNASLPWAELGSCSVQQASAILQNWEQVRFTVSKTIALW